MTVTGTRELTGNERTYGASVGPIPGAVYQPDVVLIGGGAESIVGALDNGLVWTVKGTAPGVNQLAVGKIMAATALATGRVEKVQRIDGNVAVLLAPVALTDVFQQLDVKSSSPVTLQQPLDYSFGNSPALSTVGDPGESAEPASKVTRGPITGPRLISARLPTNDSMVPAGAPSVALPEPTVSPKAVQRGKFTLTPFCCYPSEGVHIAYNEPAGRMSATVGIVMNGKPLVDFHIRIDVGGLKEAVFELNGPEAIEFQFTAATKNVGGNYQSPTLEVPVAFTFPIAGIPFTFGLTQSVRASIQLAGEAAFSTEGRYTISGGMGFAYRNGGLNFDKPHFSSQISALKNAASLSVGINAVSIGYGARFSLGIGVIGFEGGVHFGLSARLAIDKDGSPPQTSLTAGCATAAVYVQASFGVGYTIPTFVAKAVNLFLTLVNAEPIPARAGIDWGPFPLWDPGPGKRCLQREGQPS